MDKPTLLKIIMALAGVYILADCSLRRGLFNGFEFGAHLCGRTNSLDQGNLFISHSYTIYDQLTDMSIWSVVVMTIYLASKFIENPKIRHLSGLVSSLICFLLLFACYLAATRVTNLDEYFDLINQSIPGVVADTIILLVLVILEISSAFLLRSRTSETV